MFPLRGGGEERKRQACEKGKQGKRRSRTAKERGRKRYFGPSEDRDSFPFEVEVEHGEERRDTVCAGRQGDE